MSPVQISLSYEPQREQSKERPSTTSMRLKLMTCKSIQCGIFRNYTNSCDVNRYDTVEASSDSQGISMPSSWTQEDVAEWLSEHATAINEGRKPEPSGDLMEQGFDRYYFLLFYICHPCHDLLVWSLLCFESRPSSQSLCLPK